MGDLTKHFSRSEFACRCGCGYDGISLATVMACEAVREHFKRPVRINSGCRCEGHNTAVGGSKNSRHVAGDAADITVDKIDAAEVAAYCNHLIADNGGIGAYPTFTHIDTRGKRARWGG